MEFYDPSNLTQLAGGIVVALIATAFGLQKVLKGWKEVATESSVITIMHTELERMATQNQALSLELNKLQLEIVALNRELRTLSSENQRLHIEIVSLTSELNRLHTMLETKNNE